MKILVLLGSPNKNGLTASQTASLIDRLEDSSLSIGKSCDVEYICTYNVKVAPCIDCRSCYVNRACAIKDDLQKIVDSISECDVLIVATPVYFYSLPAPLKAIVDRMQYIWSAKNIMREKDLPECKKKRDGYIVATCGSQMPGMFNGIDETLKQFFNIFNINIKEKIYRKGTD